MQEEDRGLQAARKNPLVSSAIVPGHRCGYRVLYCGESHLGQRVPGLNSCSSMTGTLSVSLGSFS